MAYSTSNPPYLMNQAMSEVRGRLWGYQSTDAAATIDTTGYITNGGALGMAVGDIVMATDTGTGIMTMHRVVTVSSTYPGAVNLGDASTVGSATNTD